MVVDRVNGRQIGDLTAFRKVLFPKVVAKDGTRYFFMTTDTDSLFAVNFTEALMNQKKQSTSKKYLMTKGLQRALRENAEAKRGGRDTGKKGDKGKGNNTDDKGGKGNNTDDKSGKGNNTDGKGSEKPPKEKDDPKETKDQHPRKRTYAEKKRHPPENEIHVGENKSNGRANETGNTSRNGTDTMTVGSTSRKMTNAAAQDPVAADPLNIFNPTDSIPWPSEPDVSDLDAPSEPGNPVVPPNPHHNGTNARGLGGTSWMLATASHPPVPPPVVNTRADDAADDTADDIADDSADIKQPRQHHVKHHIKHYAKHHRHKRHNRAAEMLVDAALSQWERQKRNLLRRERSLPVHSEIRDDLERLLEEAYAA
jgi:hypothetical protein